MDESGSLHAAMHGNPNDGSTLENFVELKDESFFSLSLNFLSIKGSKQVMSNESNFVCTHKIKQIWISSFLEVSKPGGRLASVFRILSIGEREIHRIPMEDTQSESPQNHFY